MPSGRFEAWGHKIQRFALIGAAACSFALALPEVARAQTEPTQRQNLVAISIGDDNAIKNNQEGRRDLALQRSKDIEATWVRMIIYPDEYLTPAGEKNIREGLTAAKAAGYKTMVSIAMNGIKTKSPAAYTAFTLKFTDNLRDQIDAEVLGNEPNYQENVGSGITPLPGTTNAETFSFKYRPTYAALKKKYPNLEVGSFDLGATDSDSKAIDFIKEAAEACADKDKNAAEECPPLETDDVGVHPYPGAALGTEATDSGLRMSSLLSFEDKLTDLFQQGLIRARDSLGNFKRPMTKITEMGFFGGATGDREDDNLDGTSRRISYRRTLSIVCKDIYTNYINFHGILSKLKSWGGPWNTPVFGRWGEWRGPSKVIKAFATSPLHADCIQRRPAEPVPPTITAPPSNYSFKTKAFKNKKHLALSYTSPE